jgi:HAMP domain-containing protein
VIAAALCIGLGIAVVVAGRVERARRAHAELAQRLAARRW